MIVTFVSQCEKKALGRTRRVLDSFANRIGDNTWQTVITEDGLIAVKKLLRKTVTKSTAVSCHWIRSRRRSDLMWIVGNRNRFNSEGIVPVNSTQKNLSQNKWENDWYYLPLIKALVAISALLHDWGKASLLFQEKLLERTKKGDPLRHEWVSCLLLNALVQHAGEASNDEAWLNLLVQQNWDEQALIFTLNKNLDQTKALDALPPIAQLVAWLIVSHHRLPNLKDEKVRNDYKGVSKKSLGRLLKSITADWGYQNNFDHADYQHRLMGCFEFKQGLLKQSPEWNKQVKKWASRLIQEQSNAFKTLEDGSWRVVLHHSRLCLMLGDHYYSSCDADQAWKTNLKLIANTDPKTKKAKQFLDEHLVNVSRQGLLVAQSLSRLSEDMESAYDIKKLKTKSPIGFEWQDLAASEIKKYNLKNESVKKTGCFVVNMASTGKGKTIANAKIMQALSEQGDSLRYILALGLRTLTLQTGDAYRNDIGLSNDELAVLIGSKAVQELHQKSKINKTEEDLSCEEIGSESLEELLENELDYDAMPQADFLSVLFPPNKAEKNKAFLYKPVLTCTIDHIMSATETQRGGKYILPCLRLLSSDLVIDEVDDFNGQDLIAIARLVHLAGMLGRKVMISSATIPPALAEGFFNAYQHGWKLHCDFKQQKNKDVRAIWVDEFKTQIQSIEIVSHIEAIDRFRVLHKAFVKKRIDQLLKQTIKHKAYIVECENLKSDIKSLTLLEETQQNQYFDLIRQQAESLHNQHHSIDEITGKNVSFGVVRVANVSPCVAITQYLLNAEWSEHVEVRIMAYHSRQILLLRSEQEHHLDAVLVRKEKPGQNAAAFLNTTIREHLDHITEQNVIFILVATPVEEVGRDHDFDWAIIEPSSYRSIIQLSGRVLRHRKLEHDIEHPNIALMQYNLKGLKNADVAFERPGFEVNNAFFKLETKNLALLIDHEDLLTTINAIPRIQASEPLEPTLRLADLEHSVTQYFLTAYKATGPDRLQGWLVETWFLTALPQSINKFRRSSQNIQLYVISKNNDFYFAERNDFGEYINRSGIYNIEHFELNNLENKRLWLNRNYGDILCRMAIEINNDIGDIEVFVEYLSKCYGEIMLPEYDRDKALRYSHQFGLIVKI